MSARAHVRTYVRKAGSARVALVCETVGRRETEGGKGKSGVQNTDVLVKPQSREDEEDLNKNGAKGENTAHCDCDAWVHVPRLDWDRLRWSGLHLRDWLDFRPTVAEVRPDEGERN